MPAEPDLFAALAATWPAAETRAMGPWRLRRSAGGGNRVTAAILAGPLQALDAAEAAMLNLGQRPLVQVQGGQDDLDAALAARGYARRDATLLLAAPAAILPPAEPDGRVIDGCRALAAMAEIWTAGGIGADRLAVMDRAPDPRLWLLGRAGDRPAACGFIAAHDGVAMLHALEVAQPFRRTGLGARLTLEAAAWARRHGQGTFAVAVAEANAPARALYAALGLLPAGRYHYREVPAGQRTGSAARK